MTKSHAGRVRILGGVVLLIVSACLVGEWFFGVRYFLAFATFGTAITMFFDFLWLAVSGASGGAPRDEHIRPALAASTIAVSLVIVSVGVLFTKDAGAMPEFAKTLLSHFTAFVGVVVAFSYGSTACIDARRREASRDGESKPDNPVNTDARLEPSAGSLDAIRRVIRRTDSSTPHPRKHT